MTCPQPFNGSILQRLQTCEKLNPLTPLQTNMKTQSQCFYLYADGHAVQVFEKNDKDAGRITFVHIHEKWTKASLSFKGRMVFGRYDNGIPALIEKAISVRASSASYESGSDNTKAKGIAVGNLSIEHPMGHFHWTLMPDLISGPVTYQPEVVESFDATLTAWGIHNVSKIIRAKQTATA